MQTLHFFWLLFGVFILGASFFDLYWQTRKKQKFSLRRAAFWTVVWISLALLFNFLIYLFMGPEKALEFLTAYLLEKSLSLDNLFVFLVIFSYFNLSISFQQKVLKWGILGAFLMRAAFIFGGIWLLQSFHFLFFVFGGFLVFSGIKLFFQKEEKVQPEKNLFLRFVKKIAPISDDHACSSFFQKVGVKRCITPLFVVLLLIESSDLIFAIDSVPAVLAITGDPFIAYTSNAFAILGLRALYFLIAGFLPRFIYLKKGVMLLLVIVGLKMILSQWWHIPIAITLLSILFVLTFSIVLSLIKKKPHVNIQ
ncbi:MAG: TerC/Alx family metal homeostasis membrane protein [Candidatus Nealsonbacteria bacterium]